jgi:hypothetical protein
MTIVLGILAGATIVAMIWMCVYFNQEIQDVRAEARMRTSTYEPPHYHTSYKESMVKKERDSWKDKYELALQEADEWRTKYEKLADELDVDISGMGKDEGDM